MAKAAQSTVRNPETHAQCSAEPSLIHSSHSPGVGITPGSSGESQDWGKEKKSPLRVKRRFCLCCNISLYSSLGTLHPRETSFPTRSTSLSAGEAQVKGTGQARGSSPQLPLPFPQASSLQLCERTQSHALRFPTCSFSLPPGPLRRTWGKP